MRCTVLASGSKGNCSFLEDECGALLIDAGLSARETLVRIERAGLDAGRIMAILITHEHVDHIRGLDVLARRLQIPVYATRGTLTDFFNHRRTSDKPIDGRSCKCGEGFFISDFFVEPFATSHDANEPCGYRISCHDLTIGYCTDTGIVTPHILGLLKKCDGIVLESNHCPDMLANGPYPESLKRRIRSKHGHLSNPAAASCIRDLGKDAGTIVLAHLSEVNNTPEKARASAQDGLGLFCHQTNLFVATQAGSSPENPQTLDL